MKAERGGIHNHRGTASSVFVAVSSLITPPPPPEESQSLGRARDSPPTRAQAPGSPGLPSTGRALGQQSKCPTPGQTSAEPSSPTSTRRSTGTQVSLRCLRRTPFGTEPMTCSSRPAGRLCPFRNPSSSWRDARPILADSGGHTHIRKNGGVGFWNITASATKSPPRTKEGVRRRHAADGRRDDDRHASPLLAEYSPVRPRELHDEGGGTRN